MITISPLKSTIDDQISEMLSLSCTILNFLYYSTHVQYTQTDTIRQTDGPLVPMVGLVPIEKDVIPMVLLVNMHLIRGTLIIFPCDLAGNRAISMVHWYQWYDWYQWKSTLFQWFYW